MTSPEETAVTTTFLTDGSTLGTWRLDSARSTVQLKTKSTWGLVSVKGNFTHVEGDVLVAPHDAVSGQVKVATSSLDTANKKRDDHLRSKDFFDTVTYPDVTFRPTGISRKGSQLHVAGTLTVSATTLPISFPATIAFTKDREIGVTAQTVIDRSAFGLTWNQMGASSMKNTITLHAVFVKD